MCHMYTIFYYCCREKHKVLYVRDYPCDDKWKKGGCGILTNSSKYDYDPCEDCVRAYEMEEG